MPVYFGTRASMNRNPVYVGTPAAFCKWLRMYKRGSTEWRAAMVCGGSLVGGVGQQSRDETVCGHSGTRD